MDKKTNEANESNFDLLEKYLSEGSLAHELLKGYTSKSDSNGVVGIRKILSNSIARVKRDLEEQASGQN